MPSNNIFEDIEMLEVSGDEAGSSWDNYEEISQSESENTSAKAQSINLKEWLDTPYNLEFNFDRKKYEESLTQDEYSKLYVNYVTKLYKILEKTSLDVLSNINNEGKNQDIGLIRSDAEKTETLNRNKTLNFAFTSLIEELSFFIDELEKIDTHAEQREKMYLLLSILDCIKCTLFYEDINSRPELIAKWINRFDYKPDQALVESIMFNTPMPYKHPQFWNTYISQLITRGLFKSAVTAIKNSKFEDLQNNGSDTLYSVIFDLQKILENYTDMSLKGEFEDWKLICCNFRDTFSQFRKLVSDPEESIMLSQIHDLVSMMTGFHKTIAGSTDNWYELYAALSLFQVRNDKSLYGDYLTLALNEKPPYLSEEDNLVKCEKCFIDILEQNFLLVLSCIDYFEPATAAYISRLLEFKGYLECYYSASEDKSLKSLLSRKTISEYLFTTHAFECLNNHYLVPVGIGLLISKDINISKETQKYNRRTIAKFLPEFQCQTNDDLEWELTICAQLNFPATARKLYFKYGHKSFKEGYLFEAMNMFIRSCDPENAKFDKSGLLEVHKIIWDIIFYDSIIHNKPVEDDLINNIVSDNVDEAFTINPAIRQCLAPYAVLYEFYVSLEETSIGPVSKLLSKLIHLLRFRYLPKKFFVSLLSQILPLLISGSFTFSLPDLIVIIELIDNYENEVTESESRESDKIIEAALDNVNDTMNKSDWRLILKKRSHSKIEKSTSIIRYIREEITTKIGCVFIES